LCRLNSALPEGARRAPPARAHVRSCLRCQVVGTRERVLRREMARLGSATVPAPPYLAASVMARLGEQGSAGAGHRIPAGSAARRVAATGVGVTAAAAAALIAGLVRRKSRTA
ncbi:MAG: hypothetical protein KJ698_09315, partial [Actinobacteria bacterium]|nr:hypothetical protein [Actinomycetota bacterium]